MSWLRWLFVCHCGRRCADVYATPVDTPPPGAEVMIEWVCGGCGTRYRRRGPEPRQRL